VAAGATKRQLAATGARLAIVASAVKRVLIDWDWGASGIWTILSAEELSAPGPAGSWYSAAPLAEAERPRPWSDKLSADLLDALQEWNDHGGELFHPLGPDSDDATSRATEDAFMSRGAKLAAWTQRELGPDYEVLFITSTGAWQWVRPPWSRRNPP
jgi:hypothetical protein